MKHLLSTSELSREEAIYLLDLSDQMAEVNTREVKKLPT